MIIPFFLRNRGCPHRCVFCSERVTGGDGADVFPEAGFRDNVEKHLRSRGKKGPVEIAFYGGNFLEMDETVQEHLLRTARFWIEKKAVDALRLSTRPDSITEKRLAVLRKHHVGTLEIGVQSLADRVLENARRGHTAEDARRAVRMSLDGGFRTAVHLMAGLPGEKASDFIETVLETAALRPHMVRIHPTLVFRNTGLEAAWKAGTYTPLSLEEAVNRCRAALEIFEKAGVSVIRVGLQQTEALIGELVAGPYHPALRDLVASSSFLERAKTLLEALPPEEERRRVVFKVSPRDGSSFRGHRRENVRKLQNLYPRTDIEVREDGDARRGSLSLAPADGKGQAPPGMTENTESAHRSGFVAIIGKPNVGKSTLLNQVVGEKIAITTRKPQTTRNRILGIRTVGGTQFIFIDTPGIHQARSTLNRYMVKAAVRTLEEGDVVLFLIEAPGGIDEDDRTILGLLKNITTPVFLVINKIDLAPREVLLPLIDGMKDLYPFREIFPVSAKKGFNTDRLLDTLRRYLPEGPPLYPEDMITDRTERFIAAEIVREKITLLLRQEIPYQVAVVIDGFREDPKKDLIVIQATIHTARDSQKGILIGRGGRMLKEIGKQARLEMEAFFGKRVFLELFVRVTRDWPEDERMLRELGYGETT